jgi:uncharacterized protein YjbJ (UPF0337 family)
LEVINPMGADEKFDNKAQEVRGKVKKAVGRAIDDPDLEARGRADQARADIKQAAEKVKDAFRR